MEFPPDYSDDDDASQEEEEDHNVINTNNANNKNKNKPSFYLRRPPPPNSGNNGGRLATVYRVGSPGLEVTSNLDGKRPQNQRLTEDLNGVKRTHHLSRSEGALIVFEKDNMNSGTFPGRRMKEEM